MTNREAYVLGYAYGCLARKLPDYNSPAKMQEAQMRPIIGWVKIHNVAIAEGKLDDDLSLVLAEVLDEIDESSVCNDKVISLDKQGSWGLGYYLGLGGRPLPSPAAQSGIAAMRKEAGMTQAQLADALDVNQATLSRWESGKISPDAATMERIREVIKGCNNGR